MFRIRFVNSCLRRLLHVGTVNRDQVLEQLMVCTADDQVLDLVGKNIAKLTVNHVSCAVAMLWQFQRETEDFLRRLGPVKTHPQFLTLKILAQNKTAQMDDSVLVDTLYNFLRLHVEPHESVIQHLVSEAWLRLESLPMAPLSKFANCLVDHHCRYSRLVGQITSIVDKKLSSINDARILTSLMTSMSSLVTPRLRDALLVRADYLLDTNNCDDFSDPRRVVQFLRHLQHMDIPLLEKCNKILLQNISIMDTTYINMILEFYKSLQFHDSKFSLAAKQRLIELIDTSTDPSSFFQLFCALAPMGSPKIRDGLENTALLLADELTAHQALYVLVALKEMQSGNLSLMNKVASAIQRNLHVYKPMEVARITIDLYQLQYQNPELHAALKNTLLNFLQRRIIPRELAVLIRALSLLPSPRLDQTVKSRLEAVMPQCSLDDLKAIIYALHKWIQNDPFYLHNTPDKYVCLLQSVKRYGQAWLQKADRLDVVLRDLRFVHREWFEETLLSETLATLEEMVDQICWKTVPDLATFLWKMKHICPSLMDRCASVAVENLNKIHYTSIYSLLRLYSHLNYDSPQVEKLFEVCVQHVTTQMHSLHPHLLVDLSYCLAKAEYFPEELIRAIFCVDFLRKLDSHLETLSKSLSWWTRLHLMELNRAVCIECPEFQVPWFHEEYCKYYHRTDNLSLSPVQQQIYRMLVDVLGGFNYVRPTVVTPYFYIFDFECILDKHLQPVPYSNASTFQISNREGVQWETSSRDIAMHALPPGAQRVAVVFLGSKFFCKNSHHINGAAMMKKRHLEILGYRVVQIPHFEWHSMELSSPDAWKDYLRRKIFTEISS